jgi:hypothetical protein
MATDQEPITQTVQDYFGGWYDADAVPMGQALPYRGTSTRSGPVTGGR